MGALKGVGGKSKIIWTRGWNIELKLGLFRVAVKEPKNGLYRGHIGVLNKLQTYWYIVNVL